MSTRAVSAHPPVRPRLPLLVGAAIAAAAFVLGWISSHYGGPDGIVAAEALPSPTHFALIAFGAGATGMLLSHRRPRAALAASIGTLLALIALTLAGQMMDTFSQVGTYRSPDGRYDFRVSDGATTSAPQQRLRLRETRGPRSRYWDVGCVRGGPEAVRDVHWSSPEAVQLTVNGTQRTLRLGPDGPLPNGALHSC